MKRSGTRAFSLIELLITIAIIAIIAVVTVFILNPPEIAKQSRDANRVADLRTIQQAINLYSGDAATAGKPVILGNASTVYVSLPDLSSTCGSYTLPPLPSGYTYHCASPATYENTDGTGWIPIDFASTSFGSYNNLPVDPTNNTSSCTFYEYVTNGTSFAIAANVESQKEKANLATATGTFNDLLDLGSNPALIPTDFAAACSSATSTPSGGGNSGPLNTTATFTNSNQTFTFTGHAGESVNLAFMSVYFTGSCPVFTLLSPTNATIENQGTCGNNLSWNNVILPTTGTYTVSMNPGSGTASAKLYLSDSMSFGTLAFNTSTVDANTVHGQFATTTFSGTAGQVVTLAITGITWNGDNCPNYQLLSPTGTQMQNQGTCGNNMTWQAMTLPATGTYTLNMWPGDNLETSTITLTAALPPVTIPFNTPTVIANQYHGQFMQGVFSGTAGQVVTLAMTGVTWNGDNCMSYQLMSPTGTQMQSSGTCGNNMTWQAMTLPSTGTYTVNIWPGDAIATTTFTLTAALPPVTIPFNTPTVIANQYHGQFMQGVFSGTAGQVVTLAMTGVTWNGDNCMSYQLMSPTGTQMQSSGTCGNNMTWQAMTLPSTGTYTVNIWPGDAIATTTFTLTAALPPVTIPFNTPTVIANQYHGQFMQGVFSGTAGPVVTLAMTGVTWNGDNCMSYQLMSPTGTQMQSSGTCGNNMTWQAMTLPSTGTYTVNIWPGDAIATTTFTLTAALPPVTIPFNTPTVIANQYHGQFMQGVFSGTAGQVVSLAVTGVTWNGDQCMSYQLMSPSGTQMQSNGTCGNNMTWQDMTLPSTGTYTVNIWPGDDLATSTFTLSAVPPPVTIPLDTPTVIANQYRGQFMQGVFSGTAGQVVSLAMTNLQWNGDQCMSYQLMSPSGTQMQSNGTCGNNMTWQDMTLPSTGTYTVNIWSGDNLATSTFTLSNELVQNLPFETPTVFANQNRGQFMQLTFTGSANEAANFSFGNINFSVDNCPTYQLYSPSGAQLANNGTCGNWLSWNNLTLPNNGTYTVDIWPGDSLVTSTVTWSDSANLGAISLNTNTAFNNSYPGQYIYMTFNGIAGQVVRYSGSNITFSGSACPTFYLINPSNGVIQNTGVCGNSFAFGSTTLPTTGTYIVSMNPGSDLVSSTLYIAQ